MFGNTCVKSFNNHWTIWTICFDHDYSRSLGSAESWAKSMRSDIILFGGYSLFINTFIRNVQKQLSEMMIMVRYWNQSFLQSRQCGLSRKVDSSSEIVWFLGEYISSIIKNHSHNHFRSPGSAGSLAKSMRSEMGESGSESGGVDGDNINVVIRWIWL